MHIAVIGRGLIGSAAARHLAKAGVEVTLIGPDEPTDRAAHRGVFASHYDEGRITRGLDPWPFWSRVSRASISRYAEIASESGIDFFTEVGSLMAGPETSRPMQQLQAVRDRDGIDCQTYRDADLAAAFPYFAFPPGTIALHEPRRAGHISPRRLVLAQGIAAERAGARILRTEATGIDEVSPGVRIATGLGEVCADRVLVAAGGFSNLLLNNALDLAVYARTVALLRISPAEARRLSPQPSLIYLHPNGEDPYLLPPIPYPDGQYYLKMGGDPVDLPLRGEEIGDWFRSDGSTEVAAALEQMLRARMPGVALEARQTMPCVTSYAPENIATIRSLSQRVSVAVAGCGRGAKCSDELGRLGAEVVQGHALPAWALEAAVV
ncbi:FAD-dependent oxidoreductase [Pseudooceanicola sp.]|uniref:NAD(P)/FAD-dependent oxidoreductase n=1 Tax=Pseudooceanicola sp. TaxID=1914328 RepID=UPI002639389A|nr:FAD-dependent oxidoreductase [Pseudooceanicola sp.]MDF1855156.1 FAD-dependent oxidoreductase [Pseudooceanicola sp.]